MNGKEAISGEKSDRRVKYTKMVLRQSLLELMKEREINKITIKDICERADINRGTFYAHYTDQYDLLAQIENELMNDITATLNESDISLETASTVIFRIFEAIERNSDMCKILFSSYGDSDFLTKVLYMANRKCVDEWSQQMKVKDQNLLEYLFAFTSKGSVGIIQRWVQTGMKESAAEIAVIVEKMTANGLQAYFA